MKRKHVIIGITAVLLIFLSASGFYIFSSVTKIPKLFHLNSKLVSENYFTGQFEFKMLTFEHDLDKGHYLKALSGLNKFYSELKSRKGLVKIPKFKNKKEEMEFYLNLQNPKTGAFMDDSYPLFTYYEPTMNMIEKLEDLSKETGQPLKLKYPLKFLDQLNTPEELEAYLDDLSTIGWLASKFKSPFILASKITGYERLEADKLYTFSPEWKKALTKWFYEHQDSRTGFWGPKLRSTGKILDSGELGPTFSITSHFIDSKGDSLYPEYPLRFKKQMLLTALKKNSEPVPDDASTDEIHDWAITRYQGIKLITEFLWKSASTKERNTARKQIENITKTFFKQFYVKSDGAFSLYPDGNNADLDGTGGVLGILKITGASDPQYQERLWGSPEENIADMGEQKVSVLAESNFDAIKESKNINSIRVYRADPGKNEYLSGVVSVIYPKNTAIMDMADLLPRLVKWTNTTSQSMGTWTSKESVEDLLKGINIKAVPVSTKVIPLKALNQLLQENGELTLIGYDTLQIPRYKIRYTLNK